MHRAIEENLGLLQSCEALLGALGARSYATPAPVCFNATIGGHVRHLADHYIGFLHAMKNGRRVDYEARARDIRIEQDAGFAKAVLQDLLRGLRELNDLDLGGAVLVRIEAADGEPEWGSSTVVRELEFLVSHTVHHCALINVICRAHSIEVPANFGVAPSTQRHRASSASRCAR